jgi:hypothetical protein
VPIATADHHAPARRTIYRRDGLNNLREFHRAGSGTSQGWRHEEAEDPGIDEGVNHRAREPTLTLCLVGILCDERREIADGSKC